MRKQAMVTIAMAAALSAGHFPEPKNRKRPRLPFTEDELAELATLEGKEKRAYVKGLEAKYRAQNRSGAK